MIRSVSRFLSAICCVACVMTTVFVASFAPATAATVLEPDATTVSTSPAVNVKYIHGSIKNLWGIDIPYSPELKSDRYAVNMRYLLGMVDIANARLGAVKTSYGTGEYATAGAVSKNTADKAIRTLIQKPIEFPFVATTTADTTTFSFNISAKGTFYVDWGDGGDVDKYVKTSASKQTISHTYTTAGAYTVRLGGRAKGYMSSYDEASAAISFKDNRNLAKISGSLGEIFPTVSGRRPVFHSTFYGCTNLTGTIPEKLFSGISGAPVYNMFQRTFYNCSGLTGSIPSGLFSGISGAPASSMFNGTFEGCSGLSGNIPSGLFGDISGAPVEYMFTNTFRGCSGLQGNIPTGLFGNISGAPATYMFWNTFSGCSGLSGSIPAGLFGNISGVPKTGIFLSTFDGCRGLTGEIPVGVFGNLSGSPATYMFYGTFNNCSGLTGASARNPDGTPLYDVFPTATSNQVGNMYTGTCFDDNDSIPDAWGKNASCVPPEPEYPFTATVEITSSKTYSLDISAAGTFYVNWGDGSKYEKIVKADTTTQHISHTYSANGTYTVKLGGLATAYSNGGGAIGEIAGYSKMDNGINVTEITGSLGKIFPTLADGSQPGFNRTFMYGQMKTIPAELFDGIHGAPIEEMFKHTFAACTSLTEVPAGLFSGIAGAPAKNMFWGTFAADSALTKLPDGLFAGISGTPAEYMFWSTFEDCSGLTGSIPSGLFGNISGAPAEYMFSSTFENCTGLTGEIPLGLFGNLSGSPASNMLSRTFYNCSGLTGASARNPDGTPLYDVFPTATSDQVGNMYTGTCLSDNASIPTAWGHNANCTYTEPEPAAVFTVTTVPNTSEFAFAISALGSFTVDWGDGQTTKIERTNSNKNGEIIKHTYTTAGEYTIGFSGLATAYPDRTFGNDFGSTSFAFGDSHINSTCNVASASGSLGKIFPTLADGSSPRFSDLFNQCANFTEIPETLFDGITTFGNYEFYQAFAGTGITRIPAKLFAGMSGAGNYNTFMATFADTAITEIPENLFATVSALGEESTFAYTFTGTKIKTIPAGLFASITGDARRTAFLGTFQNCKNLTEIPAGLFDGLNLTNLDMAADYGVFTETFAGCSSLTGPSAQTASGEYLYDVWSANYVEELANGMYAGDEGLDDYDTMPDYLKEASE